MAEILYLIFCALIPVVVAFVFIAAHKRPAKVPRLENWRVSYQNQLVGEIYDHPTFEDGTVIVTSRVVRWSNVKNKAYTKNTGYELGKRDGEI